MASLLHVQTAIKEGYLRKRPVRGVVAAALPRWPAFAACEVSNTVWALGAKMLMKSDSSPKL